MILDKECMLQRSLSKWFMLEFLYILFGALSIMNFSSTVDSLLMPQFSSYQGTIGKRQWKGIVHFLNIHCSVLSRCKKVTWSQLMKVTRSACHLPCSLCAVQTSMCLLKPQALYISSALKPVARGITAQNLSTGFLVSDLTSYKSLSSALAAHIRWKAVPSSQNNTHKNDGGCTIINISVELFFTNVPYC